MVASVSSFNQKWLATVSIPGGVEKTAALQQGFMRDKLREGSVFSKIIPEENVKDSDLTVSPNHDTMVKQEYVEPKSQALTITFRGEPRARYIEGGMYEIPFFSITSERFEKTTQELAKYRYKIADVINQNAGLDIREQLDLRWLYHSEAAVQHTGYIVRGEQATQDAAVNGAGNGLRGKIQKNDLIDLFNKIDGARAETETILMVKTDWNDTLRWTIEDIGDQVAGEVIKKGIDVYNGSLLGKKVIVSIKSDVFKAGNIYSFGPADMVGKNYVWHPLEFWMDKKQNLLTWQAWIDVGIGIGGVRRIAKLELYNGQGSGNDDSDALPTEDEVGAQEFNEVSSGIYFPHVTLFA